MSNSKRNQNDVIDSLIKNDTFTETQQYLKHASSLEVELLHKQIPNPFYINAAWCKLQHSKSWAVIQDNRTDMNNTEIELPLLSEMHQKAIHELELIHINELLTLEQIDDLIQHLYIIINESNIFESFSDLYDKISLQYIDHIYFTWINLVNNELHNSKTPQSLTASTKAIDALQNTIHILDSIDGSALEKAESKDFNLRNSYKTTDLRNSKTYNIHILELKQHYLLWAIKSRVKLLTQNSKGSKKFNEFLEFIVQYNYALSETNIPTCITLTPLHMMYLWSLTREYNQEWAEHIINWNDVTNMSLL